MGCSSELGAFESGLAARRLFADGAIAGEWAATLVVILTVMRLSPELLRLGRLQDSHPATAS